MESTSEPQDTTGEQPVFKHEKLAEEKKDEIQEVIATKNKFTRNLTSPFINTAGDWDDSEKMGTIPEWLRTNIQDQLGFMKPSRI